VLDENPAPQRKGHSSPSKCSAHVCCRQTARWFRMPLGMEVGIDPCHIVLDGDPASPQKVTHPQFSAHVCCVQTAGWIKIPLGMEVGLDPCHIVLDGDPAMPLRKGHSSSYFSPFRPMSVAKRSPILASRYGSIHTCSGQQ